MAGNCIKDDQAALICQLSLEPAQHLHRSTLALACAKSPTFEHCFVFDLKLQL